ncbi:hypothetical protein AVEN_204872-1 [Araneus ventricosus]|uniref:Uncharacterized protein n=1 Tax=Araneus ventricosus TaxID=182803 RepID=A0A4Y2LWY7_ARAVE|nr:hypothetical protein AVEN_204872-1 [Araneus ventricosus]
MIEARIIEFVLYSLHFPPPDQLFYADDNVSSLLSFTNRRIYLLLTIPTAYEKEMGRLRKLLAEVETGDDPDFDDGDYGPEDGL